MKKRGSKRPRTKLEVVKLGPRFIRAFEFAAKKHAGQARKASTVPYIAHLMGVTSLVLEYGGDEDLAIAALLHDVVEDCGGRPMLREVRSRFGPRVARIVDGCTDSYTIPKGPWLERKQGYIRHLRNADRQTRLVSAADKLYNVRSICDAYREVGDKAFERFTAGRDGVFWYYRTLLEEFSRRPTKRLIEDLQRAFEELELLAGAGRPPVR